MYRWLLSVSRDDDTTTSLGNLCPCSVTLTIKSLFLSGVFFVVVLGFFKVFF